MSPDGLARELAEWISDHTEDHLRIGIDGATECGASTLADAVAAELKSTGRAVIRASTMWWWRPAALRLEWGREDIGSLLSGWVDAEALARELTDPLGPAGEGSFITRLRDPELDRSIRQRAEPVPSRSALILDGPFLRTLNLVLEGMVWLDVSGSALARMLPPERQWWLPGFADYARDFDPMRLSEAVVAYDHPRTPALAMRVDW